MSQSVVSKVERQETSRRSATREKGAVCFEYTDKNGEETRVRIARDVEPHYSDAIRTSEPDARDYSDALPELPLPGSGETLSDCGEEFPGLFCTGCGSPQSVGRTCRRSQCPRCWNSWAFNYGVSIASKLQGLAKKRSGSVYKHHVTVSLRESTRFNSQDPIGRGVEAIKPLLAKVGVDTGYIIYHPYRIAPEYQGDILGHGSGSGDMTWKDILEKVEGEAWSWDAIRDEFLIYSPHFHVLCISGFVDTTGVEEIEDETGIVIHRITTSREDGKERSIADLEELCKVTAYSLSHAGLALADGGEEYRTAVRPFGEVANFEAWDSVKSETKETMRQVAPTVLGIEFPDPECSETVHEHAHDGCTHGHDPADVDGEAESGGSRSRAHIFRGRTEPNSFPAETWDAASDAFCNDVTDTWDATVGIVPSGMSAPTEGQTSKCGGKLAPMWAADSYLGDLDWIAEIEEQHGEDRMVEFRQAVEVYKDLGSPRPDVPPDD